MPMNPRTLRPSSTFTPRSISGLALWLDAADSSTLYTTDAGPVTAVSAPTDISGCVGWWDAADASSITQAGGLVSQWNDKSGNGNHATASGSARPTHTAGGLNGLSVMTFDGTANSMAVAANAAFNSNDLTCFVVFRQAASANKGVYTKLSSAAGTNGFGLAVRTNSPAVWPLQKNANLSPVLLFPVDPTTAARIYSVTSSSSAAGYLDGVQSATASSTADHSLSQTVRIGSREGTEFLNGYIAEVIHFNRALTRVEVARVESYLAAKWGISGVHAQATATSDPVGAWLDKSGNGRHATQGLAERRPVIASQNGRTSVLFDGANDAMDTDVVQNSLAANATGGAAFAVFSPANDTTYSVFRNGESGHRDRFSNGASYTAVFRNARLSVVLQDAMPTSGATLLSHVVASGSAHAIRLAGTQVFSTTDDFTAWRARAAGPYRIGDSGQGDTLAGTISELLMYGRALSATEVVRIERYLAAKWGITLAPQVSNADAQNWVNRVYANGGTVSATTANAVNQFCVDIENAGIRDRFFRLNLFCGAPDASLNAVRTPLFRGPSLGGTQYGNATDTNVNFVQGDYAETGASSGLKGNGSTKFLNTGVNANELTASNSHLACGLRAGESRAVAFRTAIGTYNGSSNSFEITLQGLTQQSGTAFFTRFGTATDCAGPNVGGASGATAVGDLVASWPSFYRNGVAVGATATTSQNYPSAHSLFVFANNNANTSVINYTDARINWYSIGLAMTNAQVVAFTNAVQAFNTALSRT